MFTDQYQHLFKLGTWIRTRNTLKPDMTVLGDGNYKCGDYKLYFDIANVHCSPPMDGKLPTAKARLSPQKDAATLKYDDTYTMTISGNVPDSEYDANPANSYLQLTNDATPLNTSHASVKSYNAFVKSYNSSVKSYNAFGRSYNASVESYNASVESYNASV
jgi:hypothetical protein